MSNLNANLDNVFGTTASVGGVVQDLGNSLQNHFGSNGSMDSRRNCNTGYNGNQVPYGYGYGYGYDNNAMGMNAFGGMNMGMNNQNTGYPGFFNVNYGGGVR